MKEYNLCIAYRICPVNSKSSQRPIFQNDKLKLSELCLESFKKSLGNLKAKLFVIFDRCPKEFEQIFLKRFKKEDLIFIHINEEKKRKLFQKINPNNAYTFLKQIDILLNQNYSENIYFAEDDYLYIPNSFKAMLEFLQQPKVDFITPYDHPDYYNLKLHKYPQEYVKFKEHLWKTVGSTCGTFLTTKDKLKETFHVFKKYQYISDCPTWFSLTKKKIFFDKQFWKFNFAIWFAWKQVLFGKKYNLWAPEPSIATHMEKAFLAPNIRWENYIDKYKNDLKLK